MFIYLSVMEAPEAQSLFERIYYEYRGILYRLAFAQLQNESDAEDAVHQTFLYVAENFYKFSDGICPKTLSYLVKTVRCRAKDIKRQQKRSQSVAYIDNLTKSEPDYPGLSPLAACIAQLPERFRDALILRMYYGFEFCEIAKLMNITESNARKTVTRARNKLEELCQKEGVL